MSPIRALPKVFICIWILRGPSSIAEGMEVDSICLQDIFSLVSQEHLDGSGTILVSNPLSDISDHKLPHGPVTELIWLQTF